MKKISRIEYCAGFEPLQSGMEQDEGSRILLRMKEPVRLYAADGVHPSPLGTRVAAETIAEVLANGETCSA